MKYPPLTIFNDKDEPIGEAYLSEIHEQGLFHRGVTIAVLDPKGKLLLQKRGKNVATNANRWDISAAGYVNADEAYYDAAKRELFEEIGVKASHLKEVAYYHTDDIVEDRRLNRFIKIYQIIVPSDSKFVIDHGELSEVRWFDIKELKDQLIQNPNDFNHDLNEVLIKLQL